MACRTIQWAWTSTLGLPTGCIALPAHTDPLACAHGAIWGVVAPAVRAYVFTDGQLLHISVTHNILFGRRRLSRLSELRAVSDCRELALGDLDSQDV